MSKVAAVYVMDDDVYDRRKVGHSMEPPQRAIDLSWKRKPLKIVHTSNVSAQACKVEKTAHRLLTLAGKHIDAEWFSASIDECIEAIERAERIVAGLEPLPPPGFISASIRLDAATVEGLKQLAALDDRKLSPVPRPAAQEAPGRQSGAVGEGRQGAQAAMSKDRDQTVNVSALDLQCNYAEALERMAKLEAMLRECLWYVGEYESAHESNKALDVIARANTLLQGQE